MLYPKLPSKTTSRNYTGWSEIPTHKEGLYDNPFTTFTVTPQNHPPDEMSGAFVRTHIHVTASIQVCHVCQAITALLMLTCYFYRKHLH